MLLLTTCSPDDRKALACLRALGGADLACERPEGGALASRFLRHWCPLPHPKNGFGEYIAALERLVRQRDYSTVLALNDYTALALSQAQLPVPTAVASPDSVELAHDKFRTLELARSLGVAVPDSRLVGTPSELKSAVKELGLPVVVKLNRGNGAIGMSRVRSSGWTLPKFESVPSDPVYDFSRLLVQTELRGEVHDVCLLFHHGHPRAALTQRRLRTYPADGGVGILVETTWRPDLVDLGVRLLTALDWHGPAQVEFLLVGPRQTPTLLEINGRFWGTMDLAIQAGVNFPLLACSPERATPPAYRVGMRYRWTWPLGLLHVLQTGRGVRDFLWPQFGMGGEFWWSDPLPLLAEAWLSLRGFARRGFRLSSRVARVRGDGPA